MMNNKRGLNPLILKLSIAVAISLAGFLYSHLRTRRICPKPSPPSPKSNSSGDNKKLNSDSAPTTPILKGVASILENMKLTPDVKSAMDPVGLRPNDKDSVDEEGFLLPELRDLVMEDFDVRSNNSSTSPRKDLDRSLTLKIAVDKETEREIHSLKNMVHILQERERKLEMQLLEYYGLKEQETAVMELQNRLKINSVEAKLFNLKIESLKADKQRLEAQVADHSKVVAELESAKTKIKMLKRKIRLDDGHTKEQLSDLQHKVADLQVHEHNNLTKDLDNDKNLQRLKHLEGESTELRLANSRLQYENAELTRRIASTQILAPVLEHPEAEALQETNHQLKRQNEDLTKEIEQLQATRCSDVEELVYLRWVNACLRYELRNSKVPPGKPGARDLSKTLSPKSEEKAKQLILEYANSEGNGEKNLMDFDSEYWSSSQDSSLTDSFDLEDSSIEVSSATKTSSTSKSKFFKKLRKLLVTGKHSPKHSHSSVDRSPTGYTVSARRDSISTSSFGEMRSSFQSTNSSQQHFSDDNIRRTQSLSRTSLDVSRPRTLSLDIIKETDRRNSDVGSPYFYNRLVVKGDRSVSDLGKHRFLDQDAESEKVELMKFAEVLKSSSVSPETHGRSSYSSF
ncbi:hypothetical protein ACHQM5_028814 [Ranunculus cassubicifolius]